MTARRTRASVREEQLRLRLEIARRRRQLDRRVDRMVDRALLFGAWRGYVVQHPARSLLAAAGAGVVLGAWRQPAGRLAEQLFETALRGSWPSVWRQWKAVFTAAGDREADLPQEQGAGDE